MISSRHWKGLASCRFASAGDALNGGDAAAHGSGANAAEFQAFKEGGIQGVAGAVGRWRRGKEGQGTCDQGGGNPALVYVATASGGLFKTTNGGTTWTPIFDRQSTISIGDIAVDPHDPDVVWLGTGEANARNSVSFGDGVYIL